VQFITNLFEAAILVLIKKYGDERYGIYTAFLNENSSSSKATE